MKRRAESGFREHVARHKGIVDRFMAAVPDGRLWGNGPHLNYIRVPFGPGWALIGDSSLHQDPWTGRGIDMASVHATYLADALLTLLADPATEMSALAEYQRRRDEKAVPIYHETLNLGRDLRQLSTL
jgi:flavin-dependent dehydrogenase